MTDVSITPEDRERLAKSKFQEWFNECFDGKFGDAFSEAVKNHQGQGQSQGQPAQQQGQPAQQQGHEPVRRRSLLESCLSDTFGF